MNWQIDKPLNNVLILMYMNSKLVISIILLPEPELCI